jgi:hypothetical protein
LPEAGSGEVEVFRTMAQSITLTFETYREKRLTAAQRRFNGACETLSLR